MGGKIRDRVTAKLDGRQNQRQGNGETRREISNGGRISVSWRGNQSSGQATTGQTTENIWALKLFAPQTPLKIRKITRKQNPSKGHPRACTLVEFKEKFPDQFFYTMQIASEPLCSDQCARFKIQIPTHSISWGCPKLVLLCDPVSLLINTFGNHLEPGCKSHEQIIYYRTDKNAVSYTHLTLPTS